MLGNVLQYNSPVIVHMNPDRSNISIEVKTRLPNIKKYDEYNDVGVAVAVTGRCAAFGKIHVKSPRYLHLGLKYSPLQILNKVIQFISQDMYQY
jgi:hypothetical protein